MADDSLKCSSRSLICLISRKRFSLVLANVSILLQLSPGSPWKQAGASRTSSWKSDCFCDNGWSWHRVTEWSFCNSLQYWTTTQLTKSGHFNRTLGSGVAFKNSGTLGRGLSLEWWNLGFGHNFKWDWSVSSCSRFNTGLHTEGLLVFICVNLFHCSTALTKAF